MDVFPHTEEQNQFKNGYPEMSPDPEAAYTPPPTKKPRKNSAEKAKIREVIDEGTRGKANTFRLKLLVLQIISLIFSSWYLSQCSKTFICIVFYNVFSRETHTGNQKEDQEYRRWWDIYWNKKRCFDVIQGKLLSLCAFRAFLTAPIIVIQLSFLTHHFSFNKHVTFLSFFIMTQ